MFIEGSANVLKELLSLVWLGHEAFYMGLKAGLCRRVQRMPGRDNGFDLRIDRKKLFQALLESIASEHSARMVAMRNATENGNALVDELTLNYNKARQLAITSEMLDIVGGAEALSQSE